MFLASCFYFFLLLVELVSQGNVAGLELCNCKCDNTNSEVCDELLKVKTLADANGNELVTWKQYIPLIDRKYRQWISEDSLNATSKIKENGGEERIKDIENKLQHFEDMSISSTSEIKKRNVELEAKLKSAEQRLGDTEKEVAQLKTGLEDEKKARQDLEIKMAEFEKKLQDALSKAATLESHIKSEIAANVTTQEELIRNVSGQLLMFEKKDTDVQTKLSSMEKRLQNAENQTQYFESAIKTEKEGREQLQEEISRSREWTESRFTDFGRSNSTIYEKLQVLEKRRTLDDKAEKNATEGTETRNLQSLSAEKPLSERRNLDLLKHISSVEEKVKVAEEKLNHLQKFKNATYEIIENLCEEYYQICFTHGITDKLHEII